MALPTTRDVTFTPLSPVPSAVINDIQDAIIAEHTALLANAAADAATDAALAARIGASGALVMPAAPTAPDYHFTAARWRMFASVGGQPQTPGNWATVSQIHVEETASTPGAYTKDIVVEEGETIVVIAAITQANAVAGGQIALYRADQLGAYVLVGNITIPTASGASILNVAGAAHAVVAQNAYALVYTFGAAAGTKVILPIKVSYLR